MTAHSGNTPMLDWHTSGAFDGMEFLTASANGTWFGISIVAYGVISRVRLTIAELDYLKPGWKEHTSEHYSVLFAKQAAQGFMLTGEIPADAPAADPAGLAWRANRDRVIAKRRAKAVADAATKARLMERQQDATAADC